jgi:two-component system, chemotaxis family, protein-glutamate methylesterase/glutaminase
MSSFDVVVIGASLGGLNALQVILGGLPADFRLPIVVVQHRHRESSAMLATILQECCPLPVIEIGDKEPLRPGHVYLGPPDYHVLIEGDHLALSIDEPVLYARPSIDVLFESAASCCGQHMIGVLLTGASRDGAHGLAQIKAYGGISIAQDPATAECAVMPAAAIGTNMVDYVVPLDSIAALLTRLSAPTPGGPDR